MLTFIHRVLIKIDNFRLDSQKRTAYSTDGLHIQIGTISKQINKQEKYY